MAANIRASLPTPHAKQGNVPWRAGQGTSATGGTGSHPRGCCSPIGLSTMYWLTSSAIPPPVTTTGAPVTLTFTKPYQQVAHTFSATAGQQLALANHDWAIPGSGQTVVSVYGPDHRKLTWMVASSRLQVLPFTAPVTGDYQVVGVMDTLGGGSPLGSYKLTLSEQLDSGTIDVGGTPKPLTVARYGQQQKITFTGRVGQQLGFTDAKNVQFAPARTSGSPFRAPRVNTSGLPCCTRGASA